MQGAESSVSEYGVSQLVSDDFMSLFPVLSKALEKLMKTQMDSHITKSNLLLFPNQYGVHKIYGIVSLLLNKTDQI